MIRRGWCRNYVNAQTNRLRRLFKWAVENEMVPAAVIHGLQAVAGLRAGKSPARESDPVRPVAEEHVEAVYPFVSRQVRRMIELQLVTGMRPGEVCAMRDRDIDTTGRLWTYKPQKHKTAHHGYTRVVYLGPRAQRLLADFLKPDLAGYLFSPADADRERRELLSTRRRENGTPMSCGNRPGTNRRRAPKRKPGECYTVGSYRTAIQRARSRLSADPGRLAAWRDAHR